MCEQLAQRCYLAVPRLRVEPGTFRSPARPVTITPPSRTIWHVMKCKRNSIPISPDCKWKPVVVNTKLNLHTIHYRVQYMYYIYVQHTNCEKSFHRGKMNMNRLTYRMSQKNGTVFFVYLITSPNINRFSKFFHCQNQETICNKTLTINPTTPCVTTLPCEMSVS